MRLYLYEFVTGGGWLSASSETPPDSLLAEGRAMLTALASDVAAIPDAAIPDADIPDADIPGFTLDVLRDRRLPEFGITKVNEHPISDPTSERRAIERLASDADWTVLIAPEFDEHLLSRTRAVERCGGRLLSPSSQVVALASDKHATAEHLARHNVHVPRGVALSADEELPYDFSYPAVLKPRDGAGSLGIEFISARPNGRAAGTASARLEVFTPGIAASVACLCGPAEIVPLEPCLQRLAGGGDFSYLGGSLPIEPHLAARARRLAVQAVRTLPNPHGYIGVDLVLGADPAGSGDVVIEINPRLTTSYVGLRALSRVNLAAAMIAVAQGRSVELCWNSVPIHFSSSGICGPSSAND
jgi:predicted ATP-grasp superfamily ATP-dependent carboligase